MICGLYDIISNEKITQHNIYAMMINAPKIAESAVPGQFIHIKCGDLTLRRPISIASMQNSRLKICYEVRGEGTAWLANRKAGDKIDIMGAIGKGFDVSDLSKKVLLAGGGIGIYPLLSVAQAYGVNAHAALGFRNKAAVNFEQEFKNICGDTKVKITTDDGSYENGKKGYVTELRTEILVHNKIDLIMTCGPLAMMRGVYAEAEKRGIRCQVSMEERMACGIGACLVCVCKVNGTNERVCIDGPVFEGNEVDWNE
jgi:dihydroorotate dehydrogenase electron transfer subunit